MLPPLKGCRDQSDIAMRYVFGDYRLDTQRYELSYRNQPIKLRPKVFHVLRYLIAHRDRVVSKDELLEQVAQSIYWRRELERLPDGGAQGRGRQRTSATLHPNAAWPRLSLYRQCEGGNRGRAARGLGTLLTDTETILWKHRRPTQYPNRAGHRDAASRDVDARG